MGHYRIAAVAGRERVDMVNVPLRIVMTVASLAPEFGGPAAKALAMANAMRAGGHEVTLFSAGVSSVPGATVLTGKARYHDTIIPLPLHRVFNAARLASIVHIFGVRDPLGVAAALGARMGRVPCVLEPVGMMRRRGRNVRLKQLWDTTVGRSLTGYAIALVATSRLEADELRADGFDQSHIRVRPNGIEATSLEWTGSRGTLRRELGVPDDAPLVLFLGRLTRKKGVEALLNSVAQLADVHVLIAGPDGHDGTRQRMEGLVASLGLAQRVHVLSGGLWREDRAQAMADADIFCLYSLNENFGSAAAEAAAAGLATIVSDGCGVAEWLDSGVLTVPLADPTALTTAIRQLSTNVSMRTNLASAGRRAARRLTWPVVAEQQVVLYRTLLR